MIDDTSALDRMVPGEVDLILGDLADLVYGGEDYDQMYRSLIAAAVAVVPGTDRASIMVRDRSDGFYTAAASDPVAAAVDEFERQTGEGPCLDAIVDATPQLVADLTTSTDWPELTRRVLTETPVRSAAGFRLLIDDRKYGSLNLFADRAGALNDGAVETGIVLASFASVATAAMQARAEAGSLREGLHSNREIGKAIGLLMAHHGVSDEQAFAVLKKTSQEMNVKISTLAATLIDDHHRHRRS